MNYKSKKLLKSFSLSFNLLLGSLFPVSISAQEMESMESTVIDQDDSEVSYESLGLGWTRIYRLFNPNSQEHFYTTSLEEWEGLTRIGWIGEQEGWVAPTSGTPVYRLYNPNSGMHHFTKSQNEKNTLSSLGWRYEKIAWYSDPFEEDPIYRQYNPNNGIHHYTSSWNERSSLLNAGWQDEGTCWYGVREFDPTGSYMSFATTSDRQYAFRIRSDGSFYGGNQHRYFNGLGLQEFEGKLTDFIPQGSQVYSARISTIQYKNPNPNHFPQVTAVLKENPYIHQDSSAFPLLKVGDQVFFYQNGQKRGILPDEAIGFVNTFHSSQDKHLYYDTMYIPNIHQTYIFAHELGSPFYIR